MSPILHRWATVLITVTSWWGQWPITSLTIVYSTIYSGSDQRKHQSSTSLAFVRGIHWWPVNSPHKWPVTRKMFPYDDIIMGTQLYRQVCPAHLNIGHLIAVTWLKIGSQDSSSCNGHQCDILYCLYAPSPPPLPQAHALYKRGSCVKSAEIPSRHSRL